MKTKINSMTNQFNNDSFMFNDRLYNITANVLTRWHDDSDFDSEHGYGSYVEIDSINIINVDVKEIHPDTFDVIDADVKEVTVLNAVNEWAESQACLVETFTADDD